MKPFMDDCFLLGNVTAQKLYKEYAAPMPIVDYHCHVSPREIYEDKRFENITQVWLYGDHYKWRLMRSDGIDEHYITGNASDKEKFLKFAEVLPKAVGNPMYHWCHLELKNYFGYTGILNGDTAEEVWQITEKKLKEKNMSVRGLILQSNVRFVGTTDEPSDTLEWHKKLAADETFPVAVCPSFRPDKVMNADRVGWKEHITALSYSVGYPVDSFKTLKTALLDRIDYFEGHGCKVSDHGLDSVYFCRMSDAEAERMFCKAYGGESLSKAEADAFRTELLLACAKEYARRGWVMQLHCSCLRNPNTAAFEKLGADTGFDCILSENGGEKIARLLNALEAESSLPKTVLYSLNGSDNAFLDSLAGSFQGTEAKGKIQHGSAWWFNDTKRGMRSQLTSLAELGILGNFIGMLTDSRSFLSYARHEYFRRILCDLIGTWVENGEYPNDERMLARLVSDICYTNAVRYFGLEDTLKAFDEGEQS